VDKNEKFIKKEKNVYNKTKKEKKKKIIIEEIKIIKEIN